MANTDRELCSVTDYCGYNTATYGDDFEQLLPLLGSAPSVQPTQLVVWSGDRVDAVQISYGNTNLPIHGKKGAPENPLSC